MNTVIDLQVPYIFLDFLQVSEESAPLVGNISLELASRHTVGQNSPAKQAGSPGRAILSTWPSSVEPGQAERYAHVGGTEQAHTLETGESLDARFVLITASGLPHQ